MHMHYRDRELEIIKVQIDEGLKLFDGVFMNRWRNKYEGQMPVKMFTKFILAREKERARLEKEFGVLKGEEYLHLGRVNQYG